MYTGQCPELGLTYKKYFNMQSKNKKSIVLRKESTSKSQSSVFSPVVYALAPNKFSFLPLITLEK